MRQESWGIGHKNESESDDEAECAAESVGGSSEGMGTSLFKGREGKGRVDCRRWSWFVALSPEERAHCEEVFGKEGSGVQACPLFHPPDFNHPQSLKGRKREWCRLLKKEERLGTKRGDWSKEEVRQLCQGVCEGKTFEELSELLQRPTRGCECAFARCVARVFQDAKSWGSEEDRNQEEGMDECGALPSDQPTSSKDTASPIPAAIPCGSGTCVVQVLE